MRRRSRRLVLVASALGVAGVAAGLVLFALRDSVVFFYGPSELVDKAPAPGTRLRVGGLVEQGSIAHIGDNTISFVVTDLAKTVKITYTGLLPDLFREGQGVVAEGVVEGPGAFRAESVLAKHDETYMPREVADALKKSGVWRGGQPRRAGESSSSGQSLPGGQPPAPGQTAKR